MKIMRPRVTVASSSQTWWLILGLCSIQSIVATEIYDPIIRTESGRVRGQRHTLETKQVVETYLGIPYAKPPLGYLRFRHPQPVDRWTEVRNVTVLPSSCYQAPDTQFGDFYGATVWNSPTPISEDCLYLNIYVPRTRARRKQNLSVMVWIYGGGFYSGTPTLGVYDGKILAALGNVVVVSIGYRLGALGFLALNHPTAPGNAGLFDQLMGLEWVQRNIRNFGGNPDDVTLFGESAGSVSVSLHLLSPLSSWKFSKAIMQSGTANMPWATITMDEAKRRAEELAFDYLDCKRTDRPEEIAACLRSVPPGKIVESQWVTRGVLQFPFLPVVDGVFLIAKPTELLRRHSGFKKCPILLGSNANEGSTFLIYELSEYLDLNRVTMTRVQYTKSVKRLFHYFPQYPSRLSDRAVAAIDLQYMSHSMVVVGRNSSAESLRNINALDMAVGDSQFVCPLNEFAQIYAKEGLDVYMYYFTHRYSSNPWPSWMGVVHGDEIFFVFGEATKAKTNFTADEKNLSRRMMLYWTNFARTGYELHCII